MLDVCSARVAIVDDTASDALPLMSVLSSRGISSAYYTAQRSAGGYPESPLVGVRILFLDLGLVGDGGRADLAAAAGAVKKVIAENNGPYVLFVWSRHAADATGFVDQVVRYSGAKYKPVGFVCIAKDSVKEDGAYSFDKIKQALADGVGGMVPLSFLLDWEGAVLECAQAVVGEIFTEARQHAVNNDYQAEIARVIAAFYCADAGKDVDGAGVTDENLYSSASSCLSYVLMDAFDRRVGGEIAERGAGLAGCCRTFIVNNAITENTLLQKLASYLLAAPAGESVSYGTVVNLSGVLPDAQLDGLRGDIYNKELALFRNLKIDGADCEEKRAAVRAEFLPIAVELSNACDYAQKNIRHYRLVCGYMIPTKYFASGLQSKKGETVREIAPVLYDGKFYSLIFSSRNLITVSLGSALAPVMRLREQVVKDMQAWLSSHIGRAGILALHFS